jgi:hypothetical protein
MKSFEENKFTSSKKFSKEKIIIIIIIIISDRCNLVQ